MRSSSSHRESNARGPIPTLAVLFSCVVAPLGGCHNRLFLHPTPPSRAVTDTPPVSDARGRAIETISIPVVTMEEGYPDRCNRPRAFVLTLPGNAASAAQQLDHAAETLSPLIRSLSTAEAGRCGVKLVAMNYPGFGNSEGQATLRALGRAALDVYDHVVDEADGLPVFVHGYSMGTTAALHITASRPESAPTGLVLERGPDIPGIVMGRFGWWNAWILAGPVAASLPRSVRSVPNARVVREVPALFVLGVYDGVVRPPNGFRVYEAYGGPKRLEWLPIRHNSMIYRGEGLDDGFAWFLDQVNPKLATPTERPA